MQKRWFSGVLVAATVACSNQGSPGSEDIQQTGSRYLQALHRSGISEEVLLDQPVSIPLFSEAAGPLNISADPNGFLVTWLDSRESRGSNAPAAAQSHVVSTRVSNSGVVANPSGSFLSTGPLWNIRAGGIAGAHSAFNGQYYLIAWHQLTPSTYPLEINLSEPSEIDAVRVSTTGELLDAAPFAVSTLPAGDLSNVDAVLSNGNGFFVAWSGENSSSTPGQVQGRSLSFAGSEPELAPVTTYPVSGGDGSKYAFTFNGIDYQTAFVNAGNTGFTVGALNHPASSDCTAIASPSIDALALATNGAGETLVVYRGRVMPQNGPCTVGTKAVLIGANGLEKAPSISLGASTALPAVSYVNGKYFAAGFEIDPATNIASPSSSHVPTTLACNASACLGVVGGGVSRLSSTGAPLDNPPIVVSTPARAENEPIVTAGAGEYLAVWYEQTGDYDDRSIRAGRLDASGASLDATALPIAGRYTFIIDAGFNGTDFVVLWTDVLAPNGHAFFLTRISPTGQVKDPTGIELSGVAGSVVMACAASECLVAWADENYANPGAIRSTRLAADGTMLDSPPVQVLPRGITAMLAATNSGYVLEYITSNQPIDSDNPGKVLLQKLAPTGQPVGAPLPVAGTPQALRPCGSGYVTRTFVLVDGRFTWFASLLDSNARALEANIDLGSSSVWEPIASASLANGCAITWAQFSDNWDIYGKLLSSDAGLTSAPLPIAIDAFTEFGPALATGADGKMLLVYRHFITQAPYGSYRIAARLIDPPAFALGTLGGGGSADASSGGASSLPIGGASGVAGVGGESNSTGGQIATGGVSNSGGTGGESNSGGQLPTGGMSNSGGSSGTESNTGGQVAAGGVSNNGGSGDQNAAGMGGAVTTGGLSESGGAAGNAENSEGGEAGADDPSGGARATGGTGGGHSAGAGPADDVAGATGEGAVGGRNRHESGGNGGGCALSPRRTPMRGALPVAFMLLAFAGWRRAHRVARANI